MVSGRERVHPRPHLLDNAGALVSEHAGRVAGRIDSGGGVHVGVADAAGMQPDEHLALLWRSEFDGLYFERGSELFEHCRANQHDR